jgi:hypothetical protein
VLDKIATFPTLVGDANASQEMQKAHLKNGSIPITQTKGGLSGESCVIK